MDDVNKDRDKQFMALALREARKAFESDEVPVGAVLVKDNKIISKGFNQVELLQDATAHAEILCLSSASAVLENWRLLGTTLYTTLEPCCMCAGAIINSRISRIVYGAKDLRVGGCGSWKNLFDGTHPIHSLEVCGGVLDEECSSLIKEFFQKTRVKKDGRTSRSAD